MKNLGAVNAEKDIATKKYVDDNTKYAESLPVGSEIDFDGNVSDIPTGWVQSSASNANTVPIGTGMDYYGTVPPEDYMFADGSAISRTEYAGLFSIVGTTYGAGDGSSTFNLPDKRERVSVMYKSGSSNFGNLGKKAGTETVTLTTAQLPSHSHGITTGIDGSYGLKTDGDAGYKGRVDLFGIGNKSWSTNNAGSGNAHNNLQPYFVCNYIIKVK